MADPRTTAEDAAYAVAVQRGEVFEYRQLVERYHVPLMRYARRFLGNGEDAEDVIQEVFFRAYERIRQYDPKRPFSTWIYRIAHNACVDVLKRRKREPIPFFDPDTLFPHPVAKETPEDHVARAEILDAIEQHLSTLDAKYREVIVLHYIAERSYEEIADILRVPIATVGVRLKRARDRLRVRHDVHPYDQ